MPSVCQISGAVIVADVFLPVKEAIINSSTSGDNTVVYSIAGKRIRVLSCTFICADQVNVAWKSGSTLKVGAMTFAKYGGMDCNRHPGWWVETEPGETLVMNLSGNVAVTGNLNYVEVPA